MTRSRLGRWWPGAAIACAVLTVAAVATAAPSESDLTGPGSAETGARRLGAPVQLLPEPRSLVVMSGGDVLNEAPVNAAAAAVAGPGERFDFAPVFAPVAPLLAEADLAICHAELPIGRPGQREGVYGRSPFGGNLLLAPYELAAGLAATGFHRCSTASNHSYDLGAGGIVSTLDALDAVGISHSGTARTAEEAIPTVIDVAGVRVAHLSYTRSSNTVPPRHPWMLARAYSPRQVAGDVAAVRDAGAELVLVSIHIGVEMLPAPTTGDRRFVEELVRLAPIDLIVQHGPHVVQPYELVGGVPVYWSVGNFVSGMSRPGATGRYADPRSLDGLLAAVHFVETAPGAFRADPAALLICNEIRSRTVRSPFLELGDPERAAALPDWLRQEMEGCIRRTLPVEPRVR